MGTVQDAARSLGWRMFSVNQDPTHVIPLFTGQGTGPCLVGYQDRPAHITSSFQICALSRCNPALHRNVLLELKSLPLWNCHQSYFMGFFQKLLASANWHFLHKNKRKNPTTYLKNSTLSCESVDGKSYTGASQAVGATTTGPVENTKQRLFSASFFPPSSNLQWSSESQQPLDPSPDFENTCWDQG